MLCNYYCWVRSAFMTFEVLLCRRLQSHLQLCCMRLSPIVRLCGMLQTFSATLVAWCYRVACNKVAQIHHIKNGNMQLCSMLQRHTMQVQAMVWAGPWEIYEKIMLQQYFGRWDSHLTASKRWLTLYISESDSLVYTNICWLHRGTAR